MLPVVLLRFQFSAPDGFRRPAFPEAAWRGAFGYALKRALCLTRMKACAGCPYEFSCGYPFIFETRQGATDSAARGGDRAPHPFILRVPILEKPCGVGHVEVEMVLVGAAARHLPSVIHALGEAGRRGIGKERQSLTLESVKDSHGFEVWRPGSNLAPVEPLATEPRALGPGPTSVTLVSPLRLVCNGDPIEPEALDGPTLAFAAVRRVGLLADNFSGGSQLDFKALKAEARTVAIVDRRLAWSDRRRFSTRQERLITYGGVTGRLTLDLSEAPGVAACLDICQTVHLGKGATFGYGQIALAAD
jgi:hypothetical protein